MRLSKWVSAAALLPFLLAPILQAQAVQVQRSGDAPIYKITVNVVERSISAVNYRHRGGSTRLDFRGTPMLPNAHGTIEVEGQKGYMQIKTELKDMQPAWRFGSEYLTYVLWAVTPEGRPVNLGEVVLNDDGHGALDVTTELQAFGMIVTAEPYFAVTQPSDVVVLENIVRPETKGILEQVNAKFELLQRGQYAVNVPQAELRPLPLEKKKPLNLYEAQNAVRIAHWAGADRDAADSFQKAQSLLQQAETYQTRDPGSKPVSTAARGAVQAAEDARLIALKRQDEARIARERQASADREARAQAAAAQASLDKEKAEQQRRLEAERSARAEAERAAAQAQTERTRAEADLAAAKAAHDREAAQAEVARAHEQVEQSERDQKQLRQQLVEQFNRILETRDTTRGLIVNMSDVLFDTGRWTLKPGAREKLAKISGIVQAHPGLRLEVEGHTDSTGSDETNQILSERRADAVRDFLVQQGVSSSSITAMGMGKGEPVASNDTAVGRQLNRRVEMVVSGDIIGTRIDTGRRTKPELR